MSEPIRFSANVRKIAPVAADFVPGTNSDNNEDVVFEMTDIAAVMRILLADALVGSTDRTKLDLPVPAIGMQRRYYRGAAAPAVDYNNANPGGPWMSAPYPGTDAVWEIFSALNNGVFVPPWSVPVKISGEAGLPGLPGAAGTPGNQYFFQNDSPSGVGRLLNDVWWDLNDNFKQYRWNGTTWVESFQPMLTIDEAGRVTGLVRAGEAGKNFVLIADKFQIWNGTSAMVPFEIIDGVVYIKEAVVRQIAAAKIIGGTIVGQEIILSGAGAKIRSDDFVTGVSGWKISGTGAEFPALVVRSGNLEAFAATRPYGGSFGITDVFAANVWTEIAGLNVTMEAGNFAQINVSMIFLAPTVPYATDGNIRIKRADGTFVNSESWTAKQGGAEAVSYMFYDNTVTTRYSVEIMGTGGTCQARGINMTAIIHRK